MKKIMSLCGGLLLMFSASAFSEEHAQAALEHAQAASKAGDAKGVAQHAGVALDHALAGALVAKGAQKNHLEAGASHLEEAVAHGNMGHKDVAADHVQKALEHLKAGQK